MMLVVALPAQCVCHEFVVPCQERRRELVVPSCGAVRRPDCLQQAESLRSRIVEGKSKKVDSFKSTLEKVVLSPMTEAVPKKS